MTLSIETKGLAPEEQPMPAIPFPAINWGNDLLPERFGKNAVLFSRVGQEIRKKVCLWLITMMGWGVRKKRYNKG